MGIRNAIRRRNSTFQTPGPFPRPGFFFLCLFDGENGDVQIMGRSSAPGRADENDEQAEARRKPLIGLGMTKEQRLSRAERRA
jgi:hypothetical protein